jgi:hypothetical protein
MKLFLLSCLFISGFSILPVFVENTDAQEVYQFSISGEIDGLMPGDTLSFSENILP